MIMVPEATFSIRFHCSERIRMRLLWVLSVVPVIASRRDYPCFLPRTKRVAVELYTRMNWVTQESWGISDDWKAESSNAREDTTVTSRDRPLHKSPQRSQFPTCRRGGERTVSCHGGANILIMRQNAPARIRTGRS